MFCTVEVDGKVVMNDEDSVVYDTSLDPIPSSVQISTLVCVCVCLL
jgi:hypothetical protein